MEFITALYFQHEGKDKVIYQRNNGHDYISASEFSALLIKTTDQVPSSAKNIHARTYELGAVNFLLN